MVKVLLVYPYSGEGTTNDWPPLGLAYIAAVLKKKRCDVKIVDLSARYNKVNNDDLASIIDHFQPNIVAFSLLISCARYAYDFIKRKIPFYQGLLVAGGAHCTVLPVEPLKNGVHIVVRGEGEETIDQIIDYVEGKTSLESIKGISYRNSAGEIIHNESRPPIMDLDSLPFPALELFNEQDYLVEHMGKLSTSRGCPGQCTFCANQFSRRAITFRSPASIFREIEHIYKTYKIRHFQFLDDNFSTDYQRIIKLSHLLKDWKVDITWDCLSRLDCIDYELIKAMKHAGCKRIQIGIESANKETLKRVKKNLPLHKIDRMLDYLNELKIESVIFFMFGFPWENEQDMSVTNSFIKKLTDKATLLNPGGVLIPFPGTEIYEEYKNEVGFENWWLRDWLPDNFKPLHKLQPWYFFPYTKQQRKAIQRGLDIIEKHNSNY